MIYLGISHAISHSASTKCHWQIYRILDFRCNIAYCQFLSFLLSYNSDYQYLACNNFIKAFLSDLRIHVKLEDSKGPSMMRGPANQKREQEAPRWEDIDILGD